MVRNGAVLPNRCIKTNQAVEPGINGIRKNIRVSWCHPAWFLLFLLNLLLMLLVVLFVSKKAKIEVAISSEVRSRKMVWKSIWLAIVAAGIGGFIYGIQQEAPGGVGFGVLAILVGLIGFVFSLRYLAAKSHRDGLFSVKGCHPGFLAEIRKEQESQSQPQT